MSHFIRNYSKIGFKRDAKPTFITSKAFISEKRCEMRGLLEDSMNRYGHILLLAAFGLLSLNLGCTKKAPAPSEDASKAPSSASGSGDTQMAKNQKKWKTPSGLEIEVLKEGNAGGKTAQNGKQVSVHYTGWLTDGKKFDSSVDRGQP